MVRPGNFGLVEEGRIALSDNQ